MSKNIRATLRYISFIVFVDMAGVGLITPGMPHLIKDLAHTDLGHAAQIGGYVLASFAAMQFLFSPIIGSLSDRFGRRPVLLVTLASFAVDYAVMAITPSLTLLVIGRMLSGITGATWAAANSCIADVVPASDRGSAFGTVGAAGAAGLVMGPAIGGVAAMSGVRTPFAVAAVLAAVGVVVGLRTFAETLPPAARRPFSIGRANPIGALLATRTSPVVLRCLGVLFLCQFALQAQISIWPYYGPAGFGWTPLATGLTTAYYGILMVLVRAVLTRKVIGRMGAATTARYAILFAIPSYLMLGFASRTGTVVVAMTIGSLAGMTFPSIQAMMTDRVRAEEQGQLQGVIAGSGALTAVLAPAPMTWLFEAHVDHHGIYLPGAPFLVAAALMTIAAIVLWRLPTTAKDVGGIVTA
ncbi:MFS transporter [Sphingomonas sp. CLY1604]|uniref:MFS transporter n=1 Tax=Sphingomonas sp. CLY1604 TaxID=3457786 RepID=UPI003FD7B6FC